MKDYREIRSRVSFLELCKDSKLAAEITVNAQKKIKADAAIIFADILLILEPLGLGLRYEKSEGPKIAKPICSVHDVESLPDAEVGKSLVYVCDAIRRAKKSLDSEIALIGFAGAPFTLASYMIEGGASKDFEKTKALMRSEDNLWPKLMEKIVRATTLYLDSQIDAGADAVQLFDSWAGALTREEYKKYVYSYSKEIFKSITRVPTIHFGTGTSGFLDIFSRAGGDVIGVDSQISLAWAWQKIGYKKAIQGNLDPQILKQDLETIRGHAEVILRHTGGRPGHIFNLGHGVLPDTPEENVIALVDMVHKFGAT